MGPACIVPTSCLCSLQAFSQQGRGSHQLPLSYDFHCYLIIRWANTVALKLILVCPPGCVEFVIFRSCGCYNSVIGGMGRGGKF